MSLITYPAVATPPPPPSPPLPNQRHRCRITPGAFTSLVLPGTSAPPAPTIVRGTRELNVLLGVFPGCTVGAVVRVQKLARPPLQRGSRSNCPLRVFLLHLLIHSKNLFPTAIASSYSTSSFSYSSSQTSLATSFSTLWRRVLRKLMFI